MLTPKHRALFAAAYASQLLRVAPEDPEPAPAEPVSGDAPATKDDDRGPPAQR